MVMVSGCAILGRLCFTADNVLIHFYNQTLYPTVDLDKVDHALRRGMELTKAAFLALDVPDMDCSSMQAWTFPAHIINPQRCISALASGAWTTSYSRYYDWYEKQRKVHNSSPSIQTTRKCATRKVHTQLILCSC